MWQEFQRWGKVREVFIPRKRDKSGRRFGFVRFLDVPEPGRLERKLDQIVIGDLKLFVNRPRFAKVSKGPVIARNGVMTKRVHPVGNFEHHSSERRLNFSSAAAVANQRASSPNQVAHEPMEKMKAKVGATLEDMGLLIEIDSET